MSELLAIPYSPWSEKARWALDVRQVPYTSVRYAPLLGELELRRRLGKWKGTVSVPVLFEEGDRAIADSAAIARWANERGQGVDLFPRTFEADVARFVALSEEALDAGRFLALDRMLTDDRALGEMVPRGLRALGPVATRVAGFGVRRTLRKYGAGRKPASAHRETLRRALGELREALARASGEPKTLLGVFTFADIAMTQALAFVSPPSFGLRIGANSRRSFTDEALKVEFADLLAWRDAVYETYRPKA
jgi:glutathione S-transferase